MTRLKKGFSIVDMVNRIFGGCYNRLTFGWRWMLFYVDNRYKHLLGHQGLLRFHQNFPVFFECIENFLKRPKWHGLLMANDGGHLVWPSVLIILHFLSTARYIEPMSHSLVQWAIMSDPLASEGMLLPREHSIQDTEVITALKWKLYSYQMAWALCFIQSHAGIMILLEAPVH